MVSPLFTGVPPKEVGMASKANDRNRTKFLLDEKDIPTKWYNIQADLKTPAPPVLHPGTKNPIGPQDLAPLFPMELIKQEVSRARRWWRAQARTRSPARKSSSRTRTHPARSASRSARPSRTRRPATTRSTRSAAC